jgi:hypothetical protein
MSLLHDTEKLLPLTSMFSNGGVLTPAGNLFRGKTISNVLLEDFARQMMWSQGPIVTVRGWTLQAPGPTQTG